MTETILSTTTMLLKKKILSIRWWLKKEL